MLSDCEESYRDHVAGAEGQKADHGELGDIVSILTFPTHEKGNDWKISRGIIQALTGSLRHQDEKLRRRQEQEKRDQFEPGSGGTHL